MINKSVKITNKTDNKKISLFLILLDFRPKFKKQTKTKGKVKAITPCTSGPWPKVPYTSIKSIFELYKNFIKHNKENNTVTVKYDHNK